MLQRMTMTLAILSAIAACESSPVEPPMMGSFRMDQAGPICVVVHREAAQNYESDPAILPKVKDQLAFWDKWTSLLWPSSGRREELYGAAQIGLERNVAGMSDQGRRTFVAAMMLDCLDARASDPRPAP
jgi:hypothetical protein